MNSFEIKAEQISQTVEKIGQHLSQMVQQRKQQIQHIDKLNQINKSQAQQYPQRILATDNAELVGQVLQNMDQLTDLSIQQTIQQEKQLVKIQQSIDVALQHIQQMQKQQKQFGQQQMVIQSIQTTKQLSNLEVVLNQQTQKMIHQINSGQQALLTLKNSAVAVMNTTANENTDNQRLYEKPQTKQIFTLKSNTSNEWDIHHETYNEYMKRTKQIKQQSTQQQPQSQFDKQMKKYLDSI